MEARELRTATVAPAVSGDLSALYPLAPGVNYALEAYLKLPLSPTELYSEFWGKFLRFSVLVETAVVDESWAQVKDDRRTRDRQRP